MPRSLVHAVALLALCAAAAAQDPDPKQPLPLRVTVAGPGATVEVDRGTRDGLAVGDTVVLRPRQGIPVLGVVAAARARSATVELIAGGVPPEPGTRGEALVPASRLAPISAEAPDSPPPELPWRNRDTEWTPGQPLLGGIAAERPEDRPARFTGRAYLLGEGTAVSDEDRAFGTLRSGASLELENLLGRGEMLQLDVEANHKRAELPGEGDESDTDLRIDRLSYASGGTRFSPQRLELGRFWQRGVPELGLLDGAEWSLRRDGGDSFGLSLGYAPEPDAELSTGEDLQVAAWYRWVLDESERLSATGAFQTTWHDGAADRDLFVAKARWLPGGGWDVAGTAWLDLYTAGDEEQGPGLALSQASLRAGRRYESGSGFDLAYRRTSFPDVEADLFPEPAPESLPEGRYDRLSLSGWRTVGERLELFGELGAFDDEDDSGGDAELGVELAELWLGGDAARAAVFGTAGEFTRSSGARISYGRDVEGGRWELSYQYAVHDHEDFEADVFAVPGHRLRASRSFELSPRWHLALDAGLDAWDEDTAWSAGVFLQRVF